MVTYFQCSYFGARHVQNATGKSSPMSKNHNLRPQETLPHSHDVTRTLLIEAAYD